MFLLGRAYARFKTTIEERKASTSHPVPNDDSTARTSWAQPFFTVSEMHTNIEREGEGERTSRHRQKAT